MVFFLDKRNSKAYYTGISWSRAGFKKAPQGATGMTTYSPDIEAYCAFRVQLHQLDNESIFEMWNHVLEQNFHPDIEFSRFGLEDKISVDEFVDALTEEVDQRMKQESFVLAT